MGMFNTKSSLRKLHQPSYQLFTSEHQQLLSCLCAVRQGRDRNGSGKLPWVTQLWLILTLRQPEITFVHIDTSLSWFTSIFRIDSCLSLSTHLIFFPSNPFPRSPGLFLGSSFLLSTDNTGVLSVCILLKVPPWLRQSQLQHPNTAGLMSLSSRFPWESQLGRDEKLSLPAWEGRHNEDLAWRGSLRNPVPGFPVQLGLLVALCGICLFSSHPLVDIPPQSTHSYSWYPSLFCPLPLKAL